MPTYIVGDIHISDHASYQAHLPRALATIAPQYRMNSVKERSSISSSKIPRTLSLDYCPLVWWACP